MLLQRSSLFWWLGVALLHGWLWAAAAPLSPADLRPKGYVNDFANVIEPDWNQRLTRLATLLDQKTKAQIAIVTIDSLEGEPIEDFANRLFEAWRVGHQDNRGALLLLVVRDRRTRLEVGYGLEPLIPDGFAGSMLREMRPALRERRYGQALYAGVSLLAARIAAESGVKLDEPGLPQARRRPAPVLSWEVIVLLLAALFFFGILPWWMPGWASDIAAGVGGAAASAVSAASAAMTARVPEVGSAALAAAAAVGVVPPPTGECRLPGGRMEGLV